MPLQRGTSQNVLNWSIGMEKSIVIALLVTMATCCCGSTIRIQKFFDSRPLSPANFFDDDFRDPFFENEITFQDPKFIKGNIYEKFPVSSFHGLSDDVDDPYIVNKDPLVGSAESVRRAVDSTLFFGSFDHQKIVSSYANRRLGSNLEEMRYRSLRPYEFYEACVLFTPSQKDPTLVYLIISQNAVLVTEFPHPRTIRLLWKFSHIQEIKLGSTVPLFLSEPHRSRSYEIMVLHRVRSPATTLPLLTRFLRLWKPKVLQKNAIDINGELRYMSSATSLFVLNAESTLLPALRSAWVSYTRIKRIN